MEESYQIRALCPCAFFQGIDPPIAAPALPPPDAALTVFFLRMEMNP